MGDTIVAVFASEEEAGRARSALLGEGFSGDIVTVSADLTGDGLAAEAPGQAYENQQARKKGGLRRLLGTDDDTADARRMADVQRGTCVVSVGPLPRADCERAAATLKRCRALSVRHW